MPRPIQRRRVLAGRSSPRPPGTDKPVLPSGGRWYSLVEYQPPRDPTWSGETPRSRDRPPTMSTTSATNISMTYKLNGACYRLSTTEAIADTTSAAGPADFRISLDDNLVVSLPAAKPTRCPRVTRPRLRNTLFDTAPESRSCRFMFVCRGVGNRSFSERGAGQLESRSAPQRQSNFGSQVHAGAVPRLLAHDRSIRDGKNDTDEPERRSADDGPDDPRCGGRGPLATPTVAH